MPLGQLRLDIAIGGPDPVVETRHMAATVFALGNLALETGVVHRVILHLHCDALHLAVVTRPLGHRPALQRITDLQAKVVAPAAGMVQLHHEDRAPAGRRGLARLRLAGLVEAALAAVVAQAHRPMPGAAMTRGAILSAAGGARLPMPMAIAECAVCLPAMSALRVPHRQQRNPGLRAGGVDRHASHTCVYSWSGSRARACKLGMHTATMRTRPSRACEERPS